MAKKAESAGEEKVYIIPLRRDWVNVGRIRRANRAVSNVKIFVKKHTHSKDVTVSQKVNEFLWSGGPKKPPGKIKVKVSVSEGRASVRMLDELSLEEEKRKALAQKDDKAGAKPAEMKEVAKVEAQKPEEAVPEAKK